MATRLRKLLWITVGVILAPVILAAFYLTFLALKPSPALPQSRFLTPPANLKATGGRGQITIQWDAVPGAISYRVYRSEKADKGYRALSRSLGAENAIMRLVLEPSLPTEHHPGSPFVDTMVDNRTYFYRVRAFDGSGWSEPTPAISAEPQGGTGSVWVRADAAREIGPLEHTWEVAIGSENPGYYLKEDAGRGLRNSAAGLRRANKRLHDAFGIRYVRAHGVLMDTLGSYRETADGKAVYDWSRIDLVYDMLRADGLRPIVELSFMPAALAANPKQTIFDYHAITSPPRDYQKWSDFVGAFARHLIQRYGREEVVSWPFEVWNEPDLSLPFVGSFWHGTQDDYYRLYDFSAQALKAADPRIQVGGPAAAKMESVEPFLRHVTTANFANGGSRSPLDFLSVHAYSGLPLDFKNLYERYGFKNLPVYYTEWGLSARLGAPENDLPYGAAWVASSLIEEADKVAMIAYWTGSDYFEEKGVPKQLFHGGFGLLGIDGIRKPRFWAFYMLHQLDGPRIALEGGGDGFGGLVQACAIRNTEGVVKVLLANAARELSQAGGKAELDREVSLKVVGLTAGEKYRLRHYRVDNSHSNIYAAWVGMGKPDWPKPVPLAELRRHDLLDILEDDKEITVGGDGAAELQFALPMPGVSLLMFVPASMFESQVESAPSR
jgi:xylan 1,4-beta-xylosidase